MKKGKDILPIRSSSSLGFVSKNIHAKEKPIVPMKIAKTPSNFLTP
jgi:hypothetical protein